MESETAFLYADQVAPLLYTVSEIVKPLMEGEVRLISVIRMTLRFFSIYGRMEDRGLRTQLFIMGTLSGMICN